MKIYNYLCLPRGGAAIRLGLAAYHLGVHTQNFTGPGSWGKLNFFMKDNMSELSGVNEKH